MGDLAVRVEGLGKRYVIGAGGSYLSLRETLSTLPQRFFRQRRQAKKSRELWALKDLSLEIRQGEVLGVIGRNGAGKSTLLKILSRITWPTEGRAEVWGRVGSLLEVGTGFHPELTGRENIWLYGAILGLTRQEIRQKYDEIVAFSEVEAFLDTPLKHYSSGMQMRLAFSVAAHLEPEVLLVDEVLAVGDAAFQRKCLHKMEDVSRGGRTVVFVSHNMAAVERLCDWVVHLDGGRAVAIGNAAELIAAYLKSGGDEQVSWQRSTPADQPAFFQAATLLVDGQKGAPCSTASAVALELQFVLREPSAGLQLSVDLLNEYDQIIFSTVPQDSGISILPHPGEFRVRVSLPPDLLLDRIYRARANLYVPGVGGIDRVADLRFAVSRVASRATSLLEDRLGQLFVPCTWEIVDFRPAGGGGPAHHR